MQALESKSIQTRPYGNRVHRAKSRAIRGLVSKTRIAGRGQLGADYRLVLTPRTTTDGTCVLTVVHTYFRRSPQTGIPKKKANASPKGMLPTRAARGLYDRA